MKWSVSAPREKRYDSPREKMDHGLIAVPILSGSSLTVGSDFLPLLIMAVSLAGMQEYNRMAFGKGMSGEKEQTMVIALLILLTAVSGDFDDFYLP